MTDSQWLWLFVNEAVDHDEHMESMCDKCKTEVTSKDKCIKCGKVLSSKGAFINPNFDYERFNKLNLTNNGEIDIDLLKQINN